MLYPRYDLEMGFLPEKVGCADSAGADKFVVSFLRRRCVEVELVLLFSLFEHAYWLLILDYNERFDYGGGSRTRVL